MIGRMSPVFALALAVLLLLTLGCEDQKTTLTSPPADLAATPDAQATIVALAEARGAGTPTPTVIPPGAREVVLEFVTRQDAVVEDWEQFHADFDSWREGLISCDVSAMEVALSQFSSRFSSNVTAQARALPRSSNVRELVDMLIDAVVSEEEALRRLRNGWNPDNSAVFEQVEDVRTTALAVQQQVQDELDDLQNLTSADSRSAVDGYATAFEFLNNIWDAFHRSYDRFRAQEADLTSVEMVLQLTGLIEEFSNIGVSVRNLPDAEAVRPVSEILAKAAEQEELALRKLRGAFQKSDDDVVAVPPESPFPSDPENPTESSEVTFELLDLSLFDAFNSQLVTTNSMRRQADQALRDIVRATSEQNEKAVNSLIQQHNEFVDIWNQFHGNYDDWRRTEGGCDRIQAIERLGQFTISFGKIASTVRGLPGDAFLRPLGELLVEAAEREEQALRLLRNSWKPFDASVYAALDQERNMSGKLKRQVASGTQDILARFNISSQKLSR